MMKVRSVLDMMIAVELGQVKAEQKLAHGGMVIVMILQYHVNKVLSAGKPELNTSREKIF